MTYAFEQSGGGSGGSSSSSGGTTYATPVYFEDGTPAAPAISFSNDLHKGLYANGSGVGMTTGGTSRLFVGNDGNVSVAQNLAVTGSVTLAAGAGLYNGAYPNPNGQVTAAPGSVYTSSTGGPNATVWVKEIGFDNQGWTSVSRPTTAASCANGTPVGACVALSGSAGSYSISVVSPSSLNTNPAVGVVQTVSGTTCVVAFSGIVAGVGSNMTANAELYVGPNGSVVTDTSTLTSPYYLQPMGRAINATDGVVSPGAVSLYRS